MLDVIFQCYLRKAENIWNDGIFSNFPDGVKTLHQNVYNEAKVWFTNLWHIPRRQITNMFSSMPNCDAEQLSQSQGPVWMWWLLAAFPLDEAVQLEFISMSCVKSRLEKLQQLIRSMQSI